MFKNYLAAALRNLVRNRLYAAISIFGLAMGLCIAMMIALMIRNQLTFEHFIPNYDRTYLAVSVLELPGRAPKYDWETPARLAELIRTQSSAVEVVARISDETVVLSRGSVEAREKIYWGDPNVFEVLPLPVVAGDLQSALQRPDGIVLTRSMARKYFGRDTPLGESIQVNREHPMWVTAVIEDLPTNATSLESGIFASGRAAFSRITKLDNEPVSKPGQILITVRTYLRIANGTSIEKLDDLVRSMVSALMATYIYKMEFMKLDQVHLSEGFSPGLRSRLAMSAMISLLVLLVASINFVNLSTARAARRAPEVGVRKALGASRRALMLQFLGEAIIYALLATLIAVVLTELLLPYLNAFSDSGAVFDYWRHPLLLAWLAIGALVVAVVAGFYPAFVLSSFRPASVFKRLAHASGTRARKVLVTLQFAILIALVVAAGVAYQQRVYATREAMRVDTDQMLIIRSACSAVFLNELRELRGVRGANCSSESLLTGKLFGIWKLRDGTEVFIDRAGVEFGVFKLYGLKPIAGRLEEQDSRTTNARFVINETAVKTFGFDSPAAAIGQAIPIQSEDMLNSEIVGVVPDFSINAARVEIRPTIYTNDVNESDTLVWIRYNLINVKLTGNEIPETLMSIDKLWNSMGSEEPIQRYFLNDYIQNLYRVVIREEQAFELFSCLAMLLSCLGLIGLSASTIENRTKEIGIRKAMGAGTGEVMRLLVWQFMQPVLWANLIAWPIAGLAMNRWLQGFAYHIDLSPWLFIGATTVALLVALLTVSMHCYLVARAKPIHALRYE